MRKSRCKNKCKYCGLPITKVRRIHKPDENNYQFWKGEWIHAVLLTDDPNYYFMCCIYGCKGNPNLGGKCATP